ncbi:hypothetical protein RJ639_034212 [Escallonia herrerae]|uniref:Uncharacterized protein n=1 Tax=Escallonia herrerae TaxID=1293975 RepID=A0AA88X7X6_9ASTE|nr:hypothetical protein RJ639_034212 [Escallonia herrerae]
MASKAIAAVFLLNAIFFNCVTSTKVVCPQSGDSAPKEQAKYPKNTLRLGACGPTHLEAALCLCAAIKANELDVIKLEVIVKAF